MSVLIALVSSSHCVFTLPLSLSDCCRNSHHLLLIRRTLRRRIMFIMFIMFIMMIMLIMFIMVIMWWLSEETP